MSNMYDNSSSMDGRPLTPERLVRIRPAEPLRHRRKQNCPRKRGPDGHWVLNRIYTSSTGREMYMYKWWEPVEINGHVLYSLGWEDEWQLPSDDESAQT